MVISRFALGARPECGNQSRLPMGKAVARELWVGTSSDNRQAYGFRDMAFFKLRLYFLHERSIMMPG